MTHLRIELNAITENVTSSVIHKLYETAKAIIDAEEADDVQESLVSLKGNLLVSKAYGDEIDWLEAKFPDLHITAGARYIRFADAAVYARLSQYLGDGTGITSSEITNANIFSSSNDSNTGYPYFRGNTSITSFDELGLLPLVTTIPNAAFLNCTSLTSVDLSNCVSIGQSSFENCTSLTTCIWPASVTTIPAGCFNGCTNLESLGSKISPTRVNYDAFNGCNKLTLDDINLSSIVTIEDSVFKNSGISGVVNLTNCTYIGQKAFTDCTVTEIHGPNVTSINLWSIYNLSTLLVLDLPICSRCPSCPDATSLTTLNVPLATSFGLFGDLNLKNCRNLTTLNIPFENFTGVGNNVFENCVGLSGQTFYFGTDLQYIGEYAFKNTSINIVLRGTSVVPAVNSSFLSYSGLIYVPDELVETYKTSTGYSSVSSQIKGISELPST